MINHIFIFLLVNIMYTSFSSSGSHLLSSNTIFSVVHDDELLVLSVEQYKCKSLFQHFVFDLANSLIKHL